MINIISFMGLPGSGKDTMANEMASEIENAHIISFAEPLRDMAWEILKWKPTSENEYRVFKEGKSNILPGGYDDGREFLEILSDSVKSRFGHDAFIKLLDEKLKSLDIEDEVVNIFIPDLRMPREFAYITSCENSKIIWCNYKEIPFSPSLERTYTHNSQVETLGMLYKLQIQGRNRHGEIIWQS